MKTKMIFAIALLAFGLTAHAQQPQQTAKAVAPESLVGKYTGTYVNPKFNSTIGAGLTIKNVTGNNVYGEYFASKANCGGLFAAEGTVDGNMLDMTAKPKDVLGCAEVKIRVSVSEGGNKLDGEIIDAGQTIPIRFSR